MTMKILQLISSAGYFGAENVVIELSRELASLKIENIIGVFDNLHNSHCEIAQHARDNNLQVSIFKCRGKLDIGTIVNMAKYCKTNKVNIIHSHGYKSNIYGYVVSKIVRIPIVSTCHNWIAEDAKTKTYYALDKFLIPKIDKVVAVSEKIGEELLRIRVNKHKVSLIYNGIDTGSFNSNISNIRKEFNIDKSKTVIGTVARFTAEKGLNNLLEVASEVLQSYPDVIFLMVGDGPLRNELKEKSVALGINKKVIFTGLRYDIPSVYSSMDIFVLPSLKEGLPMSLLEAMAAKRPAIATCVGAVPSVIEDGKDGYLIEPNDNTSLKIAIINYLKDDKLRRTVALNAYNKVTREFSSSTMCTKYLDIYKEVSH